MSIAEPVAACGGLERGYCLMIGGDETIVDHLDPNLQIAGTRRRKRTSHIWGHW